MAAGSANDRDTPRTPRAGFLPIVTNGFDRVFIAVVLLIAIHLLWMRFLDTSLPL
jgi:predicted small integral membrane protein